MVSTFTAVNYIAVVCMCMSRTIGLCPQQNVLFSYLTVKEHLELYAVVKGVPVHALPLVVDDMVASLGLKDKVETRAACLSGGMQRKLQVCQQHT